MKAIYTDGAGHAEVVSSDPTAEVSDAAPTPQPPQPPATNHEPVGSVTITGDAKVGETLTASNDLKDDDGLGTITYRWFAGGQEVGQGERYTVQPTDKNKTITVKAEYSDGRQNAESVSSDATVAVEDAATPTPPPQPQPPQPGNHEGFAAINGNAKVGETLMATVTDSDNLATEAQYQWMRDGQKIDGATKQAYRLEAADEGKTISVRVEYTDGKGNHEVHSAKSAIVAPESTPNHKPFMDGNFESKVMEGKNGLVLGK